MTNQNPNPCSIDGCTSAATAKGLCSRHYMRQRRHGSPEITLPPGPKKASGDPAMAEPEPTKDPSWRDLIKVHPAAELFPLLSEPELTELSEDIKEHGLTSPVTTWVDEDGTEWLLDGRNRLDAMAAAGYRFKLHGQVVGLGTGDVKRREPERFKVLPQQGRHKIGSALSYVHHYLGTDPYAYVVSANIHRRHLTTDQRKAIAEELLKANPARSDRSIAKEVGISPTTVGTIRETVEPETATVQSGQLEQEPAKRVGRDGKARKMPASGKAAKAEEQVEVQTVVKVQPAPSATALDQFRSWYAGLSITERQQVKAVMDEVDEITPR